MRSTNLAKNRPERPAQHRPAFNCSPFAIFTFSSFNLFLKILRFYKFLALFLALDYKPKAEALAFITKVKATDCHVVLKNTLGPRLKTNIPVGIHLGSNTRCRTFGNG